MFIIYMYTTQPTTHVHSRVAMRSDKQKVWDNISILYISMYHNNNKQYIVIHNMLSTVWFVEWRMVTKFIWHQITNHLYKIAVSIWGS